MNSTILIIEDRPDLCQNIADILKLRNYSVLTAKNGNEGVNLALSSSPDLIICDIIMPELDGYGVLQILHQHPTTCQIPFIFLTSKSEQMDLKKGKDMGADEYLIKPFDGSELLDVVAISIKKSVNSSTYLKKRICFAAFSPYLNYGIAGKEKTTDKNFLSNFRFESFSKRVGKEG